MVTREGSADRRAGRIRLLLTDCDGVLTDGSVYYSPRGEALRRFSVRDGMGVERLLTLAGIETGIVSGERALAIRRRAEKLGIREIHLGVRDKLAALRRIARRRRLHEAEVAFVGDDTNDVSAMQVAGFSACPADALPEARASADYVARLPGGGGAFREIVEVLLSLRAGHVMEGLDSSSRKQVVSPLSAPGKEAWRR